MLSSHRPHPPHPAPWFWSSHEPTSGPTALWSTTPCWAIRTLQRLRPTRATQRAIEWASQPQKVIFLATVATATNLFGWGTIVQPALAEAESAELSKANIEGIWMEDVWRSWWVLLHSMSKDSCSPQWWRRLSAFSNYLWYWVHWVHHGIREGELYSRPKMKINEFVALSIWVVDCLLSIFSKWRPLLKHDHPPPNIT